MKKKLVFFALLVSLLALGLALAGCDTGSGGPGGDPVPKWWEGEYPIDTYNGYSLGGGKWVKISTTGLETSEGDKLTATVTERAGGDILDAQNKVVGKWVYIFGDGQRVGVALNLTDYDTKAQVLALGIRALQMLSADVETRGLKSSTTYSQDFYDIGYWLYSTRLVN